jgi:nucleotide-binding universal stress UspA family protein
VLSGNPADEIVEYAEKNHIDLIIMGHSRAGLERVLLGSVAHRILKLASVPVMVCKGIKTNSSLSGLF